MKKILINGGLGFIGSQLARNCVNEGFDVTILSRSDKKLGNISDIRDKVYLKIKDIQDISEEDVSGMEQIYHLAGTVDNYAIKEGEPYKDIAINCNGTIALLEACRKFNPKARILFGSTFFVNGNVKHLPVNPESPCNPLGLYGATRLAAEHFCHVYHEVFGLDPVIARFTNVFGPFEQTDNSKKAGFNYMINQALKGNELNLYNEGEFFRDYIYVDDVVSACRILADKGESNKVYYVGRGEFVKFRTLIDMVGQNIPGMRVNSITPPEFHKKVGIVDFVSDNSDLRSLGWEPKVSLEEGIKKTIQFYQERRNN